MIYHITLNRLRNAYCTKVYVYTKFALSKKTNQVSYGGRVPCWIRASAAGSPEPTFTYSSLGCFLL